MAVPVWPASLPQYFLIGDYAEQLRDNVLRSENAVGPAKTRRRATAAPWQASGSMHMTRAQYATFRTFVEDTIADGALPFTLPNQRADSGTWLVRITEAPQASAVGVDIEVSLALEVLP